MKSQRSSSLFTPVPIHRGSDFHRILAIEISGSGRFEGRFEPGTGFLNSFEPSPDPVPIESAWGYSKESSAAAEDSLVSHQRCTVPTTSASPSVDGVVHDRWTSDDTVVSVVVDPGRMFVAHG